MAVMDDRNLHEPSKIRKGRFLGLEKEEQRRYLEKLKTRISDGYFFSDTIIGKIVDEIAPALDDAVDREVSMC